MPAYKKFVHLYMEALEMTQAQKNHARANPRWFSDAAPAYLAGTRVYPGLVASPNPRAQGAIVHGTFDGTRLVQPPIIDQRHKLVILAHYLGVPGSQCQRRAQGKKCVFREEILYMGVEIGNLNKRLFDRCSNYIWANDATLYSSVPLNPGAVPVPAETDQSYAECRAAETFAISQS